MKRMMRGILSLLTALTLLMSVSAASAAPEQEEKLTGDGTEASPYLIYTPEDLLAYAALEEDADTSEATALYAVLMEDLDFTGISLDEAVLQQHDGVLDGEYHTISGISCRDALIAGNMGVVRNLIVADSEFGGNGLAAAIAMSNYGTIENCLVETTVSVKGVLTEISDEPGGLVLKAGGIVCLNYGTIQSCVNLGSVSSSMKAGGICGELCQGTIVDCVNGGTVTAGWVSSGITELDAYNGTDCQIRNCVNLGTVTGETASGILNELGNCVVSGCIQAGSETAGAILGAEPQTTNTPFVDCYSLSDRLGTVCTEDITPLDKDTFLSQAFAEQLSSETGTQWTATACGAVPTSVAALLEGHTYEEFQTPDETPAPEEPPIPDETPAPDETPDPVSYQDVAETAWYYEAVTTVTQCQLMQGMGNGLFSPDTDLTRAQLAQILYRQAGSPSVDGKSTFTDVTEQDWYAQAVTWAADCGYVLGYGDGIFGASDPITREQLATILWRYSGSVQTEEDLSSFTDSGTISSYAQTGMQWAVQSGILHGMGDNTLNPAGNATRAQVAQIFVRLMAE